MPKAIPVDDNGKTVPITPRAVALARGIVGTLSSAGTYTFGTTSTFLRAYGASGQDVFLKWGTIAATTTNFDEIIPSGQIVDFYIPHAAGSAGALPIPQCTLLERSASGTVVFIEK